VTWTTTATALEAAVAESDEIKRLHPPCNIALRGENRHVLFADRTLRSITTCPDNEHTVGPLKQAGCVEDVRTIMDALDTFRRSKKEISIEVKRIFVRRRRDDPSDDCLWEGFRCFLEKHDAAVVKDFSLQWLLAFGQRLRERHREARATTGAIEGATSEGAIADDWSPELISDTIEAVFRRAAHQIIRGRWLCLLTESTISWRLTDDAETMRMIAITDGQIVSRENMPVSASPPPSRSWRKPCRKRQRSFDIGVYDRLRIITGELRRLQSSDRLCTVVYNPAHSMSAVELERILPWV
jgi:hypothetical protein